MNKTETLLRRLGAYGKYQGFYYMIFAIEMVMEDEELLLGITKRLYPAVARRFCTQSSLVERSLRTVINVCWQSGNPNLFTEIAGRKVVDKPTVAEFIDMLAFYLRNSDNTENEEDFPRKELAVGVSI